MKWLCFVGGSLVVQPLCRQLALAADFLGQKSKQSATSCGQEATSNGEPFAGFPEIGKYRPGKRSREVITSDAIGGVLRPKWTRAMADLGGWTDMFRFKRNIILGFAHCDGHRGKRFEASGMIIRYLSMDEGKTWTALPILSPEDEDGVVVVGEKAYGFSFYGNMQTVVRTSRDGIHWSAPRKVYKPPFYLYGAMYDETSKTFWCAAHAIPKVVKGTRQIHLLKSPDAFDWQYVSTVHYGERESEATLRFEPDRTMVVIIRKKQGTGCMCWVATAKPPYKDWSVSERPVIAEGHLFFEIGGKTFVASRALYRGDDPRIKANQKLFLGRGDFSIIYKWTEDRQLLPWAVMDSMGDCSYPRLVETPTEILCSYYSQHEDEVCKPYLCAFDKAEFLRDELGRLTQSEFAQ